MKGETLSVLGCRSIARRSRYAQTTREAQNSPIRRLVILQKLSPKVSVRESTDENRIDDTGSAIDDVQWRREAFLRLASCIGGRIFVGDPTGVDGIQVNAVTQPEDSADKRGR